MQLFFVRHGQTKANLDKSKGVWNHDSPLTQEGRQQIIQTCKKMGDATPKLTLIIASPLLRTRQTASILANELNLKVNIDDRLREASVGDWGRRPVADVNNDFRKLSPEDKPNFRPPNGETWVEIGARIADLVRELEGKQYEAIILVSHDAPIRFGVGALVNSSPLTWSDVKFPTGSVTIVKKVATDWRMTPPLVPLLP
jgi:broad specificity phosphatase PhoE